ncbi:MAG: ATP synthase F0 subunit B [Actinobacteria bacterium]|nr:ATP synthase F0 subunit B [Actinomycetota bacterium]
MSLLSLLAADPSETHHWLLPETAEIIYGGIASVLVIGGLVKFAGPMVKKSMAARTERIQKELDASANDLASAQSDAAGIRTALGDIDAERARLLADANAQAEALLRDGRARLTAEVAELEAKADADISAAAARRGDELRTEIGRVSSSALDKVLPSVLDEATQQALVENFISKVGASR